MWESQILLTNGQVIFPRVLLFSPTFDEQSPAMNGIFLKGPYNLNKKSSFYTHQQVGRCPGQSCSKLTMSLVNDSLKFTLSDTQMC